MSNTDFVPTLSTDEVYRGQNTNRCLSDDLDAMDTIHNNLSNNYAAKNHTHDGYATSDHTHSGYATSDHTHSASDIASGTLSISNGGTGASTASEALSNLGIDTYIDAAIEDAIEGAHVLWNGCLHMNGSQTATLSENVGDQQNGIVLVFSLYQNNAAVMNNSNAFFVPKQLVGIYTTHVIGAVTFSSVATKSIMIHNDKLTGFDSNTQSGTSRGITYDNSGWVLTYVIGV